MNESLTNSRRIFIIRLKDLLHDLKHAGKEWWTLLITLIILQILIALYA